ncbi:MAG: hypothetical protein JXR91_07835 [Deltaproteobacteria bacterium]|nr:hypothetical protein [Deltaproteobacteria bacterium]
MSSFKLNSEKDKSSLMASQELLQLWENVQNNWDDNKAHALFIERAILNNEAPFAAQSYKAIGDETARAQIEKLSARLFSLLEQSQSKPPEKELFNYKKTVYFIIFLTLFIFILVATMTFKGLSN